MTKKIQYAFVMKKNGKTATLTHQDDIESAVFADDLSSLFSLIGTVMDRSGPEGILAAMEPGEEYNEYEIVRQEVESFPLSQEDRATILALRLGLASLDQGQSRKLKENGDVKKSIASPPDQCL